MKIITSLVTRMNERVEHRRGRREWERGRMRKEERGIKFFSRGKDAYRVQETIKRWLRDLLHCTSWERTFLIERREWRKGEQREGERERERGVRLLAEWARLLRKLKEQGTKRKEKKRKKWWRWLPLLGCWLSRKGKECKSSSSKRKSKVVKLWIRKRTLPLPSTLHPLTVHSPSTLYPLTVPYSIHLPLYKGKKLWTKEKHGRRRLINGIHEDLMTPKVVF